MTFKKAFNDTFAEALKENGFQYNKKYGMHIRFVNDELLQYITYRTIPSTKKGFKMYTVFAGILSIYTFSVLKDEILRWGTDIYIYSKEYFNIAVEEIAYAYDEQVMQDIIEKSLNDTSNVIVPIFDDVVDLDSYIEYCKKIRVDVLRRAEGFEIWQNDALALLQADNHDDFRDFFQEMLDRDMKKVELKQMGGTYEEHYNLLYRGIIETVAESRDKVYADPELYARAKKEIERRKEANLEILRKNGVRK